MSSFNSTIYMCFIVTAVRKKAYYRLRIIFCLLVLTGLLEPNSVSRHCLYITCWCLRVYMQFTALNTQSWELSLLRLFSLSLGNNELGGKLYLELLPIFFSFGLLFCDNSISILA